MVARSSGPAIAEASARAGDSVTVEEAPPEHSARSNPAPGPALVTKHPRVIMGAVMMATMMQMVDTTIANVALPYMEGSLAASRDQITWEIGRAHV